MRSAPLRDDEMQCLAALHELHVLDTASEPEFDVLAEAAATICEAPTALVSLVDADRQWFKARYGFDGPVETARELSFCAHAVVADTRLEIEDASRDPRFADHPSVIGKPHIRFYAGAPLVLSTGVRIGTLCVIDSVPRRLTARQASALDQLAMAVVRALEGRVVSADPLRSATLENRSDRSDRSRSHLEQALENVDAAMDMLTSDDDSARGAPATRRAMRLCLTSTAALLGITHRLMEPAGASLTAEERVITSKWLADETKVAGRAAYRAGLVLTDPGAEDLEPFAA